MQPLLIAAILFALAAVNGLALATCFFMAKPRPLALAMVHLAFAASGLVTLAWAVWTEYGTISILPKISLGIMLVVALAGFVQLYFRLVNKPLYTPLLLAHAMGAITGFLFLLVAVVMG
jgi:hypothetical protein